MVIKLGCLWKYFFFKLVLHAQRKQRKGAKTYKNQNALRRTWLINVAAGGWRAVSWAGFGSSVLKQETVWRPAGDKQSSITAKHWNTFPKTFKAWNRRRTTSRFRVFSASALTMQEKAQIAAPSFSQNFSIKARQYCKICFWKQENLSSCLISTASLQLDLSLVRRPSLHSEKWGTLLSLSLSSQLLYCLCQRRKAHKNAEVQSVDRTTAPEPAKVCQMTWTAYMSRGLWAQAKWRQV